MNQFSSQNSQARTFTLKDAFKRLSTEEKIIGICSAVMLISCFLPWFSGPPEDIPLSGAYEAVSFNAFQNFAYILGYMTFFCAAASFTLFLSHMLNWKKQSLPFDEHRVYVYLGEKTVLFHTIGLFIYTKQSFQYTDAAVGAGVYLGLISSILVTVFGFFYYETHKQRKKRQKVQDQLEDSFRTEGYVAIEEENNHQPQNVVVQRQSSQDIYQRAVQNTKDIPLTTVEE